MEKDDNILVCECLKGKSDAFGVLFDKYEKPIFNIAFRLTKDFDDAEDITQTVFVNAYENLKAFNPKYKFFSWIYRSAINHSLNLMSRNSRKEELNKNLITEEKTPEEIVNEIELSEKNSGCIGRIRY